jgi:isopentenyl-diphosphate delta-isomerase type 1
MIPHAAGHLMSNIRQGLLHRAFSVFLFRPTDGALLLQKRADEKITFPSMWTNTCCSHPLSTSLEREEKGELGVRRAAIRKLPHELGVPEGALEEGDFTYLTKIHYLAPCDEDDEDGIWGEHEGEPTSHLLLYPLTDPPFLFIPLISLSLSPDNPLYARTAVDYILFATKDVSLDPNPNEVSDARYVTEKELRQMFEDKGAPFFRLCLLFSLLLRVELFAEFALPHVSLFHFSAFIISRSLIFTTRPLTPQPTCSPHGSNSSATTSSSPGGNSC